MKDFFIFLIVFNVSLYGLAEYLGANTVAEPNYIVTFRQSTTDKQIYIKVPSEKEVINLLLMAESNQLEYSHEPQQFKIVNLAHPDLKLKLESFTFDKGWSEKDRLEWLIVVGTVLALFLLSLYFYFKEF